MPPGAYVAGASISTWWMRGFDYSLWEYYGANADQGWNAYCLETGWTNAIIDIALALYRRHVFRAEKDPRQ